jgi:transcriptional regulator with XRE-family HTH domain
MRHYLKIISNLLTKKNIEKQDFAKLIKKTPQTVSNYFSERSVIDIETFLKIAAVLETPMSSFFESQEKQFGDSINSNNAKIKSPTSLINSNNTEITNYDSEKLLTRVESLEREMKLKDEIIELLKEKNK